MATIGTCAVVVAGAQRTQKTVNIVTTGTFKQYAQVAAASYNHLGPIFQASGGTVAGLKTICIPGYVGPA